MRIPTEDSVTSPRGTDSRGKPLIEVYGEDHPYVLDSCAWDLVPHDEWGIAWHLRVIRGEWSRSRTNFRVAPDGGGIVYPAVVDGHHPSGKGRWHPDVYPAPIARGELPDCWFSLPGHQYNLCIRDPHDDRVEWSSEQVNAFRFALLEMQWQGWQSGEYSFDAQQTRLVADEHGVRQIKDMVLPARPKVRRWERGNSGIRFATVDVSTSRQVVGEMDVTDRVVDVYEEEYSSGGRNPYGVPGHGGKYSGESGTRVVAELDDGRTVVIKKTVTDTWAESWSFSPGAA